jgi:hypothetical protein
MLATVLGAILARTAALLGLLGRFLLATAPGTTAADFAGFGWGFGFDSCGFGGDDGWGFGFVCAVVLIGVALATVVFGGGF